VAIQRRVLLHAGDLYLTLVFASPRPEHGAPGARTTQAGASVSTGSELSMFV